MRLDAVVAAPVNVAVVVMTVLLEEFLEDGAGASLCDLDSLTPAFERGFAGSVSTISWENSEAISPDRDDGLRAALAVVLVAVDGDPSVSCGDWSAGWDALRVWVRTWDMRLNPGLTNGAVRWDEGL